MKTLLKRSVSTAALLAVLTFIFFGPEPYAGYVFNLFAILFSACAVYEFGQALRQTGHKFPLKTTSFLAAATAGAAATACSKLILLPVLIFVIHSWSKFLTARNREEEIPSIFASAFAYFLFSIPFGIIVFLYNGNAVFGVPGKNLFLYLLLVTKAGDIAAYAVGSFSNFLLRNCGGNHKMIPSISPGKSYEGAAGGLIFTLLLSWLLWPCCGLKAFLPLWVSLPAGAIFFLGGMAGDLAESAFKRACKIKDSGAFFPGIGGVLDLLDSLLVNAPLFLLFLWCAGQG